MVEAAPAWNVWPMAISVVAMMELLIGFRDDPSMRGRVNRQPGLAASLSPLDRPPAPAAEWPPDGDVRSFMSSIVQVN
ncbi:hypothetical protein GCM10010300_61970 [Streptomyces olivaceoviridis]|nr:hypothetical protein GCM10010300_61970 [Streptomyces olivaceoviridis]